MKNIRDGTSKLGLHINEDETMQSADFLSYRKVPVFRGNLMNLETKHRSRVTCVTNDQFTHLPQIINHSTQLKQFHKLYFIIIY